VNLSSDLLQFDNLKLRLSGGGTIADASHGNAARLQDHLT